MVFGFMGIMVLIACKCKNLFELAISDEFEAEKFITHILPLSEINKGISLTKSGKAIKVVLHPNDQ